MLAPMFQGSLLTCGEPSVATGVKAESIQLDDTSWVDCFRSLVIGADDLFEQLRDSVAWRTGRRWMYDREVDDPRLMCWFPAGTTDPHTTLIETRQFIEAHYTPLMRTSRRPFGLGGVALNYYRDGNDSVAFHSDREMRVLDNTLVAVLTTGAQRPFRVRPATGGPSIDVSPASGDLLVMGGRCQADWEHAVPKTKRAVGPRISASWRWADKTDRRSDHKHAYFTSRTWRPA